MEEREFKTRRNERGEDVKFLDGYSYLGKDYLLEELDVPQTKKVMALFVELDIENLETLSDILQKPVKILNRLIKTDAITKLLAIVLLEQRKDNTTVPAEVENFNKGLMRNFKPFVIRVFWDFFTMNSGLYEGIANFANEAGVYLEAVKAPDRAEAQPKKSSSSPKASPKQSSKRKR